MFILDVFENGWTKNKNGIFWNILKGVILYELKISK